MYYPLIVSCSYVRDKVEHWQYFGSVNELNFKVNGDEIILINPCYILSWPCSNQIKKHFYQMKTNSWWNMISSPWKQNDVMKQHYPNLLPNLSLNQNYALRANQRNMFCKMKKIQSQWEHEIQLWKANDALKLFSPSQKNRIPEWQNVCAVTMRTWNLVTWRGLISGNGFREN